MVGAMMSRVRASSGAATILKTVWPYMFFDVCFVGVGVVMEAKRARLW